MLIRLTAVLLKLFKKPWCNIEFMLAQWTDAHGQRIQIASIHCPKNNLIFPIKNNRPATARANATVYIWVFFILVYVWPRHQINPNASAPIVIGSFSICRDWDYFWDSVAETNRCIFCFLPCYWLWWNAYFLYFWNSTPTVQYSTICYTRSPTTSVLLQLVK